MYKPYFDALADLFYPQRCVACDSRASDVLCRGCYEELPRIEPPFCQRCGTPTAFEAFVCEECKGLDFGFETARAPLRYEGVGKEVIHSLKYRGYRPVVDRVMVPLMLEALDGEFDVVVPVPLHRSRFRKRGFNQAELMAQSLSRDIGVPVRDALEVLRKTRDQVELSGAGRRENVAGAFGARAPVAGKVLLIDDVLTTGATMSACAAALARAGAAEVHALSLCRAC